MFYFSFAAIVFGAEEDGCTTPWAGIHLSLYLPPRWEVLFIGLLGALIIPNWKFGHRHPRITWRAFYFIIFFNCHTLDQLNHNRWGPGCFKICPGELWSAADDNRWWGSSGAICRSPARETERPTLIHFLFLLQSGCAYTMGSKGLRAPGAGTALGLTALWARKALKPMVHC